MRQLLAMGLALAVIAVASVDVEAGSHKNKNYVKPCPNCGRYHTAQSYGYQKPERKSLLARMWEMEQRKNAWLKRTFLGR
ncbi:MAG: hypothetical protein HUJ26_12535 [Planctomycetaceae bacterium]|nr:hypothetical protein [Planctomycetaceae bacterium]